MSWTPERAAPAPRAAPRADLLLAAFAGALFLAGLLIRIHWLSAVPFWMDETVSASIAAAPTAEGFLEHLTWESNPPLFYVLERAWLFVFGTSDVSLRLPSLICACLAPLLVALAPAPGLRRGGRLLWAGLLAVWTPGVLVASQARSYGLLELLDAAQTLAFLGVLERPDRGRASLWCGLGALMLLTHLDALVLLGLEGLGLLVVLRARALRLWPALLCLLPPLVWTLIVLPRLTQALSPAHAWYRLVGPGEWREALGFLLGGGENASSLLFLGAVVGLLLVGRRGGAALEVASLEVQTARGRGLDAPLLAGGAAVAAVLALLAAGMVRPSYNVRYLFNFAPGVLLLVARAADRTSPAIRPTALLLTLLAFAAMNLRETLGATRHPFYNGGLAPVSEEIAASGAKRLVFFLDVSNAPILPPEMIAALGAFHLRRSGSDIPVLALKPTPGADPNPALERAARPAGSALLWFAPVSAGATMAQRWPPRALAEAPDRRCALRRSGYFQIYLCVPAGPAR